MQAFACVVGFYQIKSDAANVKETVGNHISSERRQPQEVTVYFIAVSATIRLFLVILYQYFRPLQIRFLPKGQINDN